MEDWENLLDDEKVEAVVDSHTITNKVEIEDAPVEEVKVVPEPAPPKPKKKKLGEDFDRKSQDTRKTAAVPLDPAEERKQMARKVEEADNELTLGLFAPPTVVDLKTEEDYQNYAGEVARRLSKGKSHFKLPLFYKELIKDTLPLLNSTQLSEILRNFTVAQSDKLKEEKGPVKKKSNKKVALKGLDKKGGFVGDEDEEEQIDEDYSDFL